MLQNLVTFHRKNQKIETVCRAHDYASSERRPFVGRESELERFLDVLAEPFGRAILVVGQPMMGKTVLINRMAEIAEHCRDLACGVVHYEVTPTDNVGLIMELMTDNAFEAAKVKERSLDPTRRRLKQWEAILSVLGLDKLVMSLGGEREQNVRDRLLKILQLISLRMPDNGRAIFIIDPEKHMQPGSDEAWAIVVRKLPKQIKLIFAQRPDDILVKSHTFCQLENVTRIPVGILDAFSEEEVDELFKLRECQLHCTKEELRKIRRKLQQYQGHPHTVQAVLDMLEAGVTLNDLPRDPTGISKAQWRQVCKKEQDAVNLFEAYAVLEVPVPDDVVKKVSGLNSAALKTILEDDYLGGLVRNEDNRRCIYHTILADYILDQIGAEEKNAYHERAVEVYRRQLNPGIGEDRLAAIRLSLHVRESEGDQAFVDTLLDECVPRLLTFGLLDVAVGLLNRALEVVAPDSKREASVRYNLGLVYRLRGQLGRAEQMYLESLVTYEELGCFEELSRVCSDLGRIYTVQMELNKAESMLLQALEINKELGRSDRLAIDFGRLGLIYRRRKELDKAVHMVSESLKIAQENGLRAEMGRQYGNLGLIYQDQGELDKAEEMLRKGLQIDERSDRLEGVAAKSANLGLLYRVRGDIEKARQCWEEARSFYQKMHMRYMVHEMERRLAELNE